MGLSQLELSGKRVLITGAGSGLGRQMALGLAEAGADLVLCGRRVEALTATVEMMGDNSQSVEVVATDVTDEESLQHLRSAAGQIDVLVNNAGVARLQPWSSVSMEEWRALMALNLEAPFRLCQLFVPPMVERGWGRVINIGSVYGLVSGDPRNYPGSEWDLPAYIVSKHALLGMTRHLATTLARQGVCVNMISPGMFLTEGNENRLSGPVRTKLSESTPMGRLGGDDDLKAAVVMLASEGAAFISGQNIVVDGGWTLW
jgi:NAD(P)-dependent dehydrogenase (short-subunit alcohol dehydrogenase family)